MPPQDPFIERTAELRQALWPLGGQDYEKFRLLLDCANGDDLSLAWVGAAGALSWMHWHNYSGEAADLAERAVMRCGPRAAALGLPMRVDEFTQAVAAGALYAGTEWTPRLRRMRHAVDATTPLAKHLEWLLSTEPRRGLPIALNQRRDMFKDDDELARRDPATLSLDQQQRLWRGLSFGGRGEQLVGLYRQGLRPPAETPLEFGLAAALYADGDPWAAEQVLLKAREHQRPFTWWEIITAVPPLAPELRPAVTVAVLNAYAGPLPSASE